MKTETFWFINQYSSTTDTGPGGRHFYFAEQLAKKGHTVYVICSGYTHLLTNPPTLHDDYTIEEINSNFYYVWIKLPYYKNAHDKKRIINWFIFSWKIRSLHKFLKKPSSILVSSPSPFAFLGARYLSKKLNVKLIFEVRDIWPLSLLEIGKFSKNNLFILLMQYVVDFAYKSSDSIVSNLPFAYKHILSRGVSIDKFTWVPNGFKFLELNNPQPLPQRIKDLIPQDKFIIGYTGTIGDANALNHLVSTASLLKRHLDIMFVIVGNGKNKSKLLSETSNMNNIIFIDSIPKAQIQSMLSLFDICYIGCNFSPLYEYGTAPNKIPEYMFSAKPILHVCNDAYDYIKHANCGVTINTSNPELIAEAIIKLYNMPAQKLVELGNNGKSYVEKHHDYSKLSDDLFDVLR